MAVTRLDLPEYFCLTCWRVHRKMTVLVHHDGEPAAMHPE